MKGTKAYKVVTMERGSCMVRSGPYKLKYLKGTTVHAVEGSIGIMCFRNLKDTNKIKHDFNKVIIVSGYGSRGFRLMSAYHFDKATFSRKIVKFYKDKKEGGGLLDCLPLLKGTVLFDKVEVLT